jgi:flagellar motor switch protein FliN
MATMHESIASFIGRVASGIESLFPQAGFEGASVSWLADRLEESTEDLQWWSCRLGSDPSGRVFAGAAYATWEDLGRIHEAAQGSAPENDFAALLAPLRSASGERFGFELSASDAEPAGRPERGWPAAEVTIRLEDHSVVFYLAVNPELAVALGASVDEPVAEGNGSAGPIDMLMHVELPVSVSLGRTRMLMKDLLSITSGSIVELDQELDDEVEVRVNNCTIARGEVVSVDGNYGVRIVEIVARGMMAGRNGKDLPRLKGLA